MNWVVLLRPAAESDLTAARDWYEQQQPGLGSEFVDEVAAAMRLLESVPERERLYYRNFRRVLLDRFPYKIFYQVIDRRVVIFRVLHSRQCHDSLEQRS